MKIDKNSSFQIPEEIINECLKWTKGDSHEGEFDKEAIKRMIYGSWQLKKFLKIKPTDKILEVGPFFNPQIDPASNPKNSIVWWENEEEVISYLSKKYGEKYKPVYVDLNNTQQSLDKLEKDTQTKLSAFTKKDNEKFDVVIASQLLNYINFRNFLYLIKNFLKKGGLIYINNVVDYGLPEYFSDYRPKSDKEILDALTEHNFKILKAVRLDRPRAKDNYRLIVIAQLK